MLLTLHEGLCYEDPVGVLMKVLGWGYIYRAVAVTIKHAELACIKTNPGMLRENYEMGVTTMPVVGEARPKHLKHRLSIRYLRSGGVPA